MTPAIDVAALRQHPFVRTLDDAAAARLRACARESDFAAGDFIFREGGEADTLYLVRSGCVALEQHVPGRGVLQVESLCQGDILGLSWLLPPARWMLDARCVDAVRTFALSAACVRACMHENPALGLDLLTHTVQALYQRLVRVRLQRLDLYRTVD